LGWAAVRAAVHRYSENDFGFAKTQASDLALTIRTQVTTEMFGNIQIKSEAVFTKSELMRYF